MNFSCSVSVISFSLEIIFLDTVLWTKLFSVSPICFEWGIDFFASPKMAIGFGVPIATAVTADLGVYRIYYGIKSFGLP